jgi:hypothetical protein
MIYIFYNFTYPQDVFAYPRLNTTALSHNTALCGGPQSILSRSDCHLYVFVYIILRAPLQQILNVIIRNVVSSVLARKVTCYSSNRPDVSE